MSIKFINSDGTSNSMTDMTKYDFDGVQDIHL